MLHLTSLRRFNGVNAKANGDNKREMPTSSAIWRIEMVVPIKMLRLSFKSNVISRRRLSISEEIVAIAPDMPAFAISSKRLPRKRAVSPERQRHGRQTSQYRQCAVD